MSGASRVPLRLRATSLLLAVRRQVRSAPYLRKWVILGALIGVVAGVGAVVFFTCLELGTRLLLGLIAGYYPPSPAGEGAAPITSIARPWLLPVVVGLGGLISGAIVFRFAPEAEGHGTDAAIDAYHHGPRRIRARVPLVKIVASAITIGSGGSAGREGPTAQISAGFGSFLARLLDLDARDARIAVAVGIGSGIGSIFRAPLGGAVLGAEILYRDDVESEALVPSFIASIVGYSIYGSVEGFTPIFGAQTHATWSQPSQLLYYAALGIAAGLVGLLYVRTFYGLTRWFRSWTIPRTLRPAIAGVAVGLMGIVLPGALGTGYGWLQTGFTSAGILALPLWVLLLLPFAKILATSLSIGSGGSGGIFGPGMVIGGLLGAAMWRLLLPIAPGMPSDPAPFTIVAMMALFGSVAHAPLAVMLMVAEMTGNLSMLAPAMVAVGLATFVVGEASIYASQLRDRDESPAHQYRTAMPLMASITVGQALRMPRAVARPGETAAEVLQRAQVTRVPGIPVLGAAGDFAGIVTLEALANADPAKPIDTLTSTSYPTARRGDGLDRALEEMSDNEVSWLPVVEAGQLVGVISSRDVMRAYRLAAKGNVRVQRGPGETGTIVEATLSPGSPLVGATIKAIPWPRDSLAVAIERGQSLLVPRGEMVLAAGDRLSVFAAPDAVADVRALLDAGHAPGGTPPRPETEVIAAPDGTS
ncbi:MAG: chloride channel protein [Candidatus Limnocylindrales bacterium]